MSKVYLINTNIKNNPSCVQDMINNAKCSAYYSPWKYYIEEIEAHDIVFLYSNGKGIIARGIATGIIEKVTRGRFVCHPLQSMRTWGVINDMILILLYSKTLFIFSSVDLQHG